MQVFLNKNNKGDKSQYIIEQTFEYKIVVKDYNDMVYSKNLKNAYEMVIVQWFMINMHYFEFGIV
jgi:hypothetical protein